MDSFMVHETKILNEGAFSGYSFQSFFLKKKKDFHLLSWAQCNFV